MEEIGRLVKTDKITTHGYHRFYEDYLNQFRDKEINMLEIGIHYGSSLELWKRFLPKAFIYGLDINVQFSDERTQIFRGDQSNVNDLEKVIQELGSKQLHFINDDGSHIPEHQVLTFDKFFPRLLCEGGIYIIEDVEVSYWKRSSIYTYPTNYGYQNRKSIVEIFKNVIDYVNSKYLSEADKKVLREKLEILSDATLNSISSVVFAQNCIIIKKKYKHEYVYNNSSYPWSANV